MNVLINLCISVWEIIRYRFEQDVKIVFYSSVSSDHKWVQSLYQICLDNGINCCIIIPETKLDLKRRYKKKLFQIHPKLLQYIHTQILITASTGYIPRPKECSDIIHIPHSVVSFHMAYSQTSFNSFDVLFVCGEYQRKEIDAICDFNNIPRKKVEVTGYSNLESLLFEFNRRKKFISKTKKILIAPSWGDNNILELLGIELIEGLLKKGYNVVLRPHPSFFKKSKIIIELKEKCKVYENFSIENSTTEDNAIFDADLMISDYSGIAYEYIFLRDKPVLFIDCPLKVKNQNWKLYDIVPMELLLRDTLGKVSEPVLHTILNDVALLLSDADKYISEIQYHKKYYVGDPITYKARSVEIINNIINKNTLNKL